MTAEILLSGAVLFLVALCLHVLVWRIRMPGKDAVSLFFIFFVVAPLLYFIGFGSRAAAVADPINGALVMLLHCTLSAVYIASYPAAQAISPSLDILLVVHSSETRCLSETEINRYYNDKTLVTARIEDLGRSILVKRCGDKYALTAAGSIVIGIFAAYRRMLGLPAGEG